MSVVVENLVKVYGTQRAVDGISFALPSTGVVGFLGPNGAGKTTTLRVLAGYLQPTSGRATVAGHDVVSERLAAVRRVGYLAEHNPLYPDLYVAEYLALAGALQGLSGADLTARVERAISLTGLTPERHKPLGQLSKGYRQRAGIAQAILHEPAVLILDEPTSGLDPNQLVEIRQLIRTLGQSRLVLFSSHILQEVEAVADHLLVIQAGRLVLDAPLAEVRARLSGGEALLLEVAQPGLDPARLAALPGVTSVVAEGPTRFRLTVAAGADPRQAIFDAVVAERHAIRGLSSVEHSLEGLFRELTTPSAAPGQPTAESA